MRIVITGASGNLGTALLRRLRDESAHDLVGICRRPPGDEAPYTGVDWVALDLAAPDAGQALAPVMAGADSVVHLAWGFQPARDHAYLERVGVGGTRAVVSAATTAGVPHLVHASSVGAYSPGVGSDRVGESWPTGGVDSLPYSRHKVAAERVLDEHEAHHDGPAIARLRPGFVVQRDAGSALLRYGAPAYLPAALLRHVPVLPLDRSLTIPLIHADDLADAVARVLERRATGAFNLAGEPPVTRALIADALGARAVHLPRQVLRAAASAGWAAHLHPLDPGWIDLAFAAPLMDTARARQELGWSPEVDARDALAEVVAGMAETASSSSPALRSRSRWDQARRLVRQGPLTRRRLS